MLLDYALDRFKLDVLPTNPYRHAVDGEIERTPYQTLVESDVKVDGSTYYWSDSYTSVFDMITSEWYDTATLSESAKARVEWWGNERRIRECRRKTISNSDRLFGYQWQTGLVFDQINHNKPHLK